jgi:ankyrin repeat protein
VAFSQRHLDIIALLVTADANIEARVEVRTSELVDVIYVQGWTPLHLACSKGDREVVSVLLTAGAQIESQDQVWIDQTCFHLSSVAGKDSPPPCLFSRLYGIGVFAVASWSPN